MIVSASMMTDAEKVELNKTATPEKPILPGMYWRIKYADGIKRLARCSDCGGKSPQSFSRCPVCGTSFSY
jgi:hypothetical protein